MIESLRRTKPWVRLLAIVGYIMAGLIMLIGLGMGGFGIFQMSRHSTNGAVLVGMGALYIALGFLYIFPSRYLYQYASAIGDALVAPSKSHAVEKALGYQRSFWKFAGIMTLIGVLLYIPGIIAAIAIPNLLTAMQRSKQKRTIADMRVVAAGLESYGKDAQTYPNSTSYDEVADMIEKKYNAHLPHLDGWGHPFVYQPGSCSGEICQAYFLASTGKDGRLERQQLSDYAGESGQTTSFDEDIVCATGLFVRAPHGVE